MKTLLHRYRRLWKFRRKLGQDFDKLRPQEISAVLGVSGQLSLTLLGK